MLVTRFAAMSLALFALAAMTAPAAKVLEVKHSPATGQYASVTAALVDAADGDTIEIVDNSAPFVESLNIKDKPNLTLQGQAGLDPRPTIQGVANTHPVDSANNPEGATLIWTGNSMNQIVRDLIVDGTATDNAIETRFITPALLENVKITLGTTGPAAKRGIFAGADLIVRGCEVGGNGTGIDHWFGGNVTIENTRIVTGRSIESSDQGIPLYMHGGSLTAIGCFFKTLSPEQVIRFQFADEITNADSINLVSNSVLTSGYTGTNGTLLITCRQHTGYTKARKLTLDNCDFVGSSTQTPSTTYHAFGTEVSLDEVRFVDSIICNTQANFFANYANLGATVLTEDFCVFQKTIRDPEQGAFTPGSNSRVLAETDPLYVNAAAEDFHLAENSIALALNSTGSPAYAGSQGSDTSGVVNAVRNWSLY